jgi:hypothetical protein
MGYDIGECLICYCKDGKCNPDADRSLNICADCFLSSGAKSLRGRSRDCFSIYENLRCSFCAKEKVCLYEADFCDTHAESLNHSGRYDLWAQDPAEGVCQESDCACPHCPKNEKPHLRDLFTEKENYGDRDYY